MNTISKIHQRFSNRLNEPRVLTEPQEFLGPNYKAVLNFWLCLVDLSKEEWKVVEKHEWHFYKNNFLEWEKALDLACDASKGVVGFHYADEAGWAVMDTIGNPAYGAIQELIGMHILLDQQKPLTFFNMFLEP